MGLKQNIHIYMVWGPPSPLSPWPRNGPGLDSTLAKKVNDQHSDYNKPIILNNSLQEIQQLEKNSTLFYYFFFLLKILVQLFSFFLLFFTFCLFFSFCFSLFLTSSCSAQGEANNRLIKLQTNLKKTEKKSGYSVDIVECMRMCTAMEIFIRWLIWKERLVPNQTRQRSKEKIACGNLGRKEMVTQQFQDFRNKTTVQKADLLFFMCTSCLAVSRDINLISMIGTQMSSSRNTVEQHPAHNPHQAIDR